MSSCFTLENETAYNLRRIILTYRELDTFDYFGGNIFVWSIDRSIKHRSFAFNAIDVTKSMLESKIKINICSHSQ